MWLVVLQPCQVQPCNCFEHLLVITLSTWAQKKWRSCSQTWHKDYTTAVGDTTKGYLFSEKAWLDDQSWSHHESTDLSDLGSEGPSFNSAGGAMELVRSPRKEFFSRLGSLTLKRTGCLELGDAAGRW